MSDRAILSASAEKWYSGLSIVTGKPHARGNLSAVLTKPTSAIMQLGRIECEGISLISEPMRKEALRLAGAGSAHTAGYGLYQRPLFLTDVRPAAVAD